MAKNWLIFKIAAIISMVILLLVAGRGVYTAIITKGSVEAGLGIIVTVAFLLIISSIAFQIINLILLYSYLPRVEEPSKKIRQWHRIFFFINGITVLLMYIALAINIDTIIKMYTRYHALFANRYLFQNVIFLITMFIGNSFNFYTIPLAPRLLKYLRHHAALHEEALVNNLGNNPAVDD